MRWVTCVTAPILLADVGNYRFRVFSLDLKRSDERIFGVHGDGACGPTRAVELMIAAPCHSQFSPHVLTHRPSDDLPGEKIQNHGQIEPAFGGWHTEPPPYSIFILESTFSRLLLRATLHVYVDCLRANRRCIRAPSARRRLRGRTVESCTRASCYD
jgi:hypothetical protein